MAKTHRRKTGGLQALQGLLDCCHEAILLLNRRGQVVAANLAAGAWLDRPTPELVGNGLREVLGGSESLESLLEGLPDLALGQRLTGILQQGEEGDGVRAVVSRVPESTHGLGEDVFLVSVRPDTPQEQLLADTMAVNERVEDLHLTLAEVKRQLVERTLQLTEQRNMMQVILRGIGDGLLVFDDKGNVLDANPVALELLGCEEKDITGSSLEDVCPPLHAAAGRWEGMIYGPRTPREDLFSFQSRDLRAGIAPLWRDDEFLGCVVVLIDRTKEAEVDRLKSDLISIVSHELRSPLTSIKGYLDLLVEGELGEVSEEHKQYLELILSNTNRLAALIDDMLDLSRIESGKLQMDCGKVDVNYLLAFSVMTLKPQAAAKSITMRHDSGDGEFSVAGDVDRLQQALTNLVSNAIKYTHEGGTVTIHARFKKDEIHISVADTGLGISKEDQKRVFEKFYRVKTKATRGIGGTGLGLCIAKSILEAHAGRIELESQPSHGSTFTMILPSYETSPLH